MTTKRQSYAYHCHATFYRIVTPEGLSIDTTPNRLLEVLAQNSHVRFL